MRKIKWQLKETFTFSQSIGKPRCAEGVQVTPKYTVDRSENAVQLEGIYTIFAYIDFAESTVGADDLTAAILIEDIDQETGYFEYAAPFKIDLPLDANDPLEIITLNTTSEIDEQGCFSVIWTVQCSYKEVVGIEQSHQAKELSFIEGQSNNSTNSLFSP